MRKIGYLVLFCLLNCSLFAVVPSEPDVIRVANYTYRISDQGAFIHSYKGLRTQLALPSEIEGIPVVGVCERAFIANPKLRSVLIPSTITEIGEGAFAGSFALREILVDPLNPNYSSTNGVLFDKEVKRLIQYPAGNKAPYYKIPVGTVSLEPYSFIFSKNLNYVLLPEGVEEIGEHAFEGAAITRIELPSSLKKLGPYAFLSCSALKSIQIEGWCEGLDAFTDLQHTGSTQLAQWEYDELGTLIPIRTLAIEREKIFVKRNNYPTKPKDYTSEGELLYTVKEGKQISILGYQYKYPTGKGSAKKRSVRKVGEKNLVIPETLDGLPVTEIADRAFFCAFDLENVWLPETVTRLGEAAFMYCTSLSYIELPENLSYISSGTFRHCHSLEEIALGEKISYLGSFAFDGCSNLVSFTVPPLIQNLNEGLLLNCSGLLQLDLGNNLTTIGKRALEGCSSLVSVYIPKNLEEIEETFETCSSLEFFEVAPDNEHFLSIEGVLFDKPGQTLIRYPRANRDELAETKAREEKPVLTNYYIPDGVENISTFSFSRSYGLTNIVIPSTVTKIEPCAFYMCTNLLQATIPDSIEAIPPGAFSRSYSLQQVKMGKNLKHIYTSAFASCRSLNALYFTGDAPEENSGYLDDWNKITIYRLKDSAGWESLAWIGKQLQFWVDNSLLPADELEEESTSVKSTADQDAVLEPSEPVSDEEQLAESKED
ncbi:MAG: leucine-rich repeat domain-containing protein [Limisphaerales bacterium]|jgi:hypothetical protein|nr:leucine-rich repeat domain-containing protein [Verrucomicrobiota bacterium]